MNCKPTDSNGEQDTTGVMQDIQGFFKDGQREAMYTACEFDHERLLILILWKSGRRISEILRLKVEDIDLEHGNVLWHIEKKSKKIKNPDGSYMTYLDDKGKKHYKTQKIDLMRWKPCNKKILEYLKEYIKCYTLKSQDYLFGGYGSKGHLTRQSAFKLIRKLAKKVNINFVGIKRPHPHHFRHSFAIDKARKLKSPADMRKLQQYMEHSDMGMTEQYLQFGDEDQRSLVEDEE